jgi:hypothetical protein
VIAAGVILTIAYYLPIAPVNSHWWKTASALQTNYLAEIGWPELVEETASIRDSLAPEQRAHLGILTGSPGAAGRSTSSGPGTDYRVRPAGSTPFDSTATAIHRHKR